jgi:hypothetical protein
MAIKPPDSWEFWRKSCKAVNDLNDAMQILAACVAQTEPIDLPPHIVIEVNRAIKLFQENFSRMVREQKRKVGRKS